MKNKIELLPHEIIFGLYLLAMWARLVCTVGILGRDALIYLGFLIGNVVLILWCSRHQTNPRWRLRLLFYPVAMNVFFAVMKSAVPAVHPQREDKLLQAVDRVLVGGDLSVRLQHLVHPALTEVMSFCYILFFPNLLFAMIYYFSGDLERLKKFFVGLFSLYGLGYLGYSLMPALGPHLAMPDEFTVPLQGWLMTRWNSEIVRLGSNHVDVFPSLHCAVSSYVLLFDRRHTPWRYQLGLTPCVGLWFSTVYLRYHYFVDVICGFALSAMCLWVANRYGKEQHEIPAQI